MLPTALCFSGNPRHQFLRDTEPTRGLTDIDLLDVGKGEQACDRIEGREGRKAEQTGIVVRHDDMYLLGLPDNIFNDHQIRLDDSPIEVRHLGHQISQGLSVRLLETTHLDHQLPFQCDPLRRYTVDEVPAMGAWWKDCVASNSAVACQVRVSRR